MSSFIQARQNFDDGDDLEFDNNDRRTDFWWTRTGQIARWSIFLAIFVLIMAYIIIGYWHAKRRINKGLAPLKYHRWLLNRQTRARYDPSYQNPSAYYQPYPPQDQQYGLHSMPPPMYDPNAPLPPSYQPPPGATKVDPSQWGATQRPVEVGEPSPAYEAPPGPPPAAVQANHTGSTNNPYRL
ncbi:hypothetical protein LOCC1_G003344 [Lachnellula occidentalis]|uniref:Uncharacterized protein n=1 Tax=Lachnellula occidentalis TaxID=215460 RepID=A0A8H8S4B0_9HELO|nr:hypothetical protein LOCC1_G003344 [Lachnellula occidentalis]